MYVKVQANNQTSKEYHYIYEQMEETYSLALRIKLHIVCTTARIPEDKTKQNKFWTTKNH